MRQQIPPVSVFFADFKFSNNLTSWIGCFANVQFNSWVFPPSSHQTMKCLIHKGLFFFALIFTQFEIFSVNNVSAVSRTGIGWKETLLGVDKHVIWQMEWRSWRIVGWTAPLVSGHYRIRFAEAVSIVVGKLCPGYAVIDFIQGSRAGFFFFFLFSPSCSSLGYFLSEETKLPSSWNINFARLSVFGLEYAIRWNWGFSSHRFLLLYQHCILSNASPTSSTWP